MEVLSTIALILLLCIFACERLYKRRLRRRSLPPGPPGWPILGNLADVPQQYAWKGYASLAKQYGDLMYLEVFGKSILVISSYKRASDLMEKRSATTSDRPQSTMMLDILGLGWDFPLLPYGDRWRQRRRILQNYYQKHVVQEYQPSQTIATRRMLKDFLHEPALFFDHVRKQTGSIILKETYGYDAQPKNDPLIQLADYVLDVFNEITKQPLYLVDIFPILKYIPMWFPGAHFRRIGQKCRIATDRLLSEPFTDVKSRMASNMASPCLVTKYLGQLETNEDSSHDQEEVIRDAAGVSYGAGSDTTVSSILTFILAMLHYPEVQQKAQAELDSVIGVNQLPDFEHRENLPYINAIVLETLRWQPVSPIGVVHSTTAEEVYDGYRIPAGTLLQPNIWAMMRDEDTYPDPERFNPDRFIVKEGEKAPLDPTNMCFGFGRRICPGRYFAVNTIWIAVVSILSAFKIEKAVDEEGKPILPEVAYKDGIITYPKPFKCEFVPRSDEVVAAIERQADMTE